MRIDCDVPGYEHCFIELSNVWTRQQMRDFWQSEGDAYITLIAQKTTAIYLEVVGDGAIIDPSQLTEAALDGLDYLLFQWFNAAPIIAVQEIQRLGEATKRRLYLRVGESTAQENATPTPL